MPELPEVETIRRDLESLLVGETILRFDVFDARFLNPRETTRWSAFLSGQRVKSLGRKGKYLWISLQNNHRLVIHLRMTGQLIAGPYDGVPRMKITFKSGKTLALYDQRRFAEGWLLAPDQALRASNPLGPDALDELNGDLFQKVLHGRTTAIHPLLLDQRRIAGVGNIYAQEALFKAMIRPTRPSKRISHKETSTLLSALMETLQQAIAHRGSSSRNYTDGRGARGSAQTLHAVYQKAGSPCPRCHAELRGVRVGGRGAVYCPRCQK